ncbi:MAG TPA: hypothetical protein VFO16_05530 [Pseudonocardiaceae bacterium]|nr:hypothetical protein [Pseudonocardiaceae bacterium]
MLVNVLVSVGQFQRDLQNQLTREGLAAAWAKGNKSGRRPQVAQLGVVDDVRQAYRTGTSIAALAREHGVSRGAIRTAVADPLPSQPENRWSPPSPRRRSWKCRARSRHLHSRDDLDEAQRHALLHGRTVRRDQGYSLHVTATPEIHHAMPRAAAPLNAEALPRRTARHTGSTGERLNNSAINRRDD